MAITPFIPNGVKKFGEPAEETRQFPKRENSYAISG
jgi:hypothetical protein